MRSAHPIERTRARLEDLPREHDELAALQRRELDHLAVEKEFEELPTEVEEPEAKRPATRTDPR